MNTSKLSCVLVCAAVSALAVSAVSAAPAAPAAAYKAPLNAYGQPDLEGTWTNASLTVLERPKEYGTRRALSEEETKKIEGDESKVVADGKKTNDPKVKTTDPADGRLPPYKAGVTVPNMYMRAHYGENPENQTLAERCLTSFGYSAGPVMLPLLYNNNYEIAQSKDTVAIVVEMVHDVRMIHIGGKHRTDGERPWMGDSIGWYEGPTLVVETTNFPE